MYHNKMGNIAIAEWVALGERFNCIEPGVFVIMPNHMHGILHILDSSRAGQPQGIAPTVGDMIGAYKSQVATECLDICKATNQTMGKLWQRNYYEHIIRNEASYHTIANYIINNPASWENDILGAISSVCPA